MSDSDERLAAAFTELADRLGQGEALDDIRRALLPAPWTDALQAAAVARLFDEEAYAVIRNFVGGTPPGLTTLLERGAVEEVPGHRLSYQVPDADRPAYLIPWLEESDSPPSPKQLIELEWLLSEHWRSRGRPAEQLRHLMLADPEGAAALFDELFLASDTQRDFTRCQDLVDVLADPDRAGIAPRPLLKLAEDRAGYLRARTYWAADYARCAQFLEPDGLWERARRLLSAQGPRVWQMHGTGGTGKTMQLRWLVSRKAVTAEADINCARIDFDVVDPLNAAHWPWLLLLEAAEQLEQRLPQRVFTGLEKYAAYRSLLRRPTSRSAAEAARGIRSQDENRIGREVVDAFTSRFNKSFGTERPALLVVDTLEEVVLRSASHTDGLLRLLGETVRACPALRLILSGRHDLSIRHGQALASLGDYENVQVAQFTPDEADRYLRDIREVRHSKLREIIVRRSDGMPFHLALFADVTDQNPEVTAEELGSLRDPLIRYLVKRVLRRIEDPVVLWLVRYGVIPRRLRREHVHDILRPHLEKRRTAGPAESADDPLTDAHQLHSEGAVFPPVPPPDRERLNNAWGKLLQYAGGSSWISEVAGDEESVVFHSVVLGPMRDLISDKNVFTELHRDFAQRFEQRAADAGEADPENWAWYLRESLYHRFQMRDPRAPRRWRSAMERAWAGGNTDQLRGLAEEILGDEYVDREVPRQVRGGTVITFSLMAEAHLNIAYAQFREAMAEGTPSVAHDHVWAEIELHLKRADELFAQGGISAQDRPHSVREDVVRAAMLGLGGSAGDAVHLLDQHVLARAELPSLERLWALSIRAAQLRLLRSEDTAAAYHQVLAFAGEIGQRGVAATAASEEAAQRRLMGDVGRAIELYAQAAELLEEAGQPTFQAIAQRAGLLLRCRRAELALGVLEAARVTTPSEQADKARLQAKAQLLLGREEPALTAIHRADIAAGQLQGAERYRHLAQNAQLRGVALGELQELSDANDWFTSAAGLWSELGYLTGEPECHYLFARFLLRDCMDFTSAHRLLEPKESPGQEPEFALRLHLLAREWARRTHGVTSVEGMPVPYGDLPALVRPLQVLCRIADLTEDQEPGEHLEQLATALGEVRPAQARLATLRDLVDNPALEHRVPWPLLRPFYEMTDDGDNPDQALAKLLIAQVGGEDPARLKRAVVSLVEGADGNRLIVWRCARIAARLGHRKLAVRLLHRVPWEQPRPVPSDAPRIPHARLALAALVLLAGIEPDRTAAVQAFNRAVALASHTGIVQHSLPMTLTECARRVQVDGVPERIEDLLLSLSWPVMRDTDRQDGLRLFQDWPGERTLALRRRPDIDPVDDEASPHPAKLAAWHADEWLLRAALSRPTLRRLRFARLESDDPTAHALPWEMTLQHALDAADDDEPPVMYRTLPSAARHIDVRWLQLRMNRRLGVHLDVDGLVGPETRKALHRIQPGGPTAGWPLVSPETRRALQRDETREPGPRKVLVFSTKQEERVVPLSYWQRRLHLQQRRFPVKLVVVDSVPDLADRLTSPPDGTDALHIAAPLRQRDGMPYLEFSPPGHARRLESKALGSDVFPSQLARWLAGFEPGRTPLVVLDPPCPGSEVDLHVQLALRNLFAAQLFRLGDCPAVVCTGLFPDGGLEHVIAFYQALSEESSVAHAVRGMRTAAGTGSEDRGTTFETNADALRATALFAASSALLRCPMGQS
ncbi:hypothetical protein OG746_41535 [Streptomyces sp. NBC_01016]|uniref:hypothetical protein n=1 Tax=Streptomyces sp. NBC_01016 TaxID=2903720 RepID=UPI002254303B|nr:hypothetical protein [Streptomyces sp. NBC_01016]MCX4835189.1 hypothetical protein [Streptomyces sp. NBC_01016]